MKGGVAGGDRVGGMNGLKYDEHGGVGIYHTWTRHAIMQLNCVRRPEVGSRQTKQWLVLAGSSRFATKEGRARSRMFRKAVPLQAWSGPEGSSKLRLR